MDLRKSLFSALFVVSCLLPVTSAWGVAYDEILEACVKSGIKQAGRNSDEIADAFRKTSGKFSSILQADPDYLRRASQLVDNDTLGLGKKLSQLDDALDAAKAGRYADDLTDMAKSGRYADDVADAIKAGRHTDDFADAIKGGRHVDDFLDITSAQLDAFKILSKGQQAMVLSVQETVIWIARRTDGADIIKTLGKKGIVFGATYGDDALLAAYKFEKSGALSLVSETRHISDGEMLKFIKGSDVGIPLADVSTLRRMSNMDSVDAMKSVGKRFGPNGVRNVSNFCADIASGAIGFVRNNPKKVLAGVVIATICFKPNLIVDAAGNLLANATEVVAVGLTRGMGRAAGTVMTLPAVAADSIVDGWVPGAPGFIKAILKPIVWFFIVILGLYIIPPTRFIARSILTWCKKILRWLCSFIRSLLTKKAAK